MVTASHENSCQENQWYGWGQWRQFHTPMSYEQLELVGPDTLMTSSMEEDVLLQQLATVSAN